MLMPDALERLVREFIRLWRKEIEKKFMDFSALAGWIVPSIMELVQSINFEAGNRARISRWKSSVGQFS